MFLRSKTEKEEGRVKKNHETFGRKRCIDFGIKKCRCVLQLFPLRQQLPVNLFSRADFQETTPKSIMQMRGRFAAFFNTKFPGFTSRSSF
ncbi:Pectinesterase PPME1 [Trichinella spiralis]|uniref:Pectinesterase PPME1 n=1 Tax=Trichinella spiralis TaxID=6334 RepID=A0ABR3KRT3_TRISP